MRHRPAAIVAGVVLATTAVGFVAYATSDSEPDRDDARARTRAPVVSRATTTTRDISLRCGAELPVDFEIPAGFDGPVRAKADEAPPLELGQLSFLWTAPDASLEVRWPADAALRAHVVEMEPGPPSDSIGVGRPLNFQRTPSGIAFQQLTISKGDQQVGCQVLQLTVYGSDDGVRRADDALNAQLFVDTIPFITGSEDVAELPTAEACPTPPGIESPNRGGAGDGVAHPTPQDALAAFLAAEGSLPEDGYIQLDLAGGTYAFGHRTFDGARWVIVIHVASVADGWAVDHWDASGC
jgi:hypothetical protein